VVLCRFGGERIVEGGNRRGRGAQQNCRRKRRKARRPRAPNSSILCILQLMLILANEAGIMRGARDFSSISAIFRRSRGLIVEERALSASRRTDSRLALELFERPWQALRHIPKRDHPGGERLFFVGRDVLQHRGVMRLFFGPLPQARAKKKVMRPAPNEGALFSSAGRSESRSDFFSRRGRGSGPAHA